MHGTCLMRTFRCDAPSPLLVSVPVEASWNVAYEWLRGIPAKECRFDLCKFICRPRFLNQDRIVSLRISCPVFCVGFRRYFRRRLASVSFRRRYGVSVLRVDDAVAPVVSFGFAALLSDSCRSDLVASRGFFRDIIIPLLPTGQPNSPG